jgi:hypothetical protein
MTSVLGAFNQQFKLFVEDIVTIFPDNRVLKKTKILLEAAIKGAPRIVLMFWKNYIVTNYEEKIERGDISFFLDKDYSHDVHSNGADSTIIDMIEQLRQPIRDMGETNQRKCMSYIQTLTTLAKMYYGEA